MSVGQQHRQLVVRHRHLAAGRAVHDRDRAAPVALAGQQPVAQAEVDRRAALAARLQVGGDPRDALLGGGQAVVAARVDQHPLVAHGLGQGGAVQRLLPRRLDHHPHRQAVLAGELEVALVVGGHGHDGAGAVLQQHVVGGPDGDQLAVDRVDGVRPQEHALLVALGGQPLDLGLAAHPLGEGAELRLPLGAGDQPLGQRVLGGEHEEGGPEQRVRPGGEDPHRLAGLGHLEVDVGPGRAPDPVALHGQDLVGPVQVLHVVQQPLGVVGDLEEPLGQLALLDQGVAALAVAVDHLLVGQDRLVVGAPVDRRGLAVGQPPLEEPQEQPLGPAVVVRVAGDQGPRPVERDPQPVEGGPLGVDVLVGPGLGVDPALDGRVLGGQAEGVPADRVEHVVALHPLQPGDHVAARERLQVAHVQVAGGVREHVEGVEAGPAGVALVAPVERQLLPGRHPLGLHLLGLVALGVHRKSPQKTVGAC